MKHFFCVASKKSIINVVLATLELNMYSVGDLLAKLTILHPNLQEKPDKNMRSLLFLRGLAKLAVVWMCQGSWQVSCVQNLAHCFMLFEGFQMISFYSKMMILYLITTLWQDPMVLDHVRILKSKTSKTKSPQD